MTGAGVGVSINESTQLGIVITGLEIVERGLGIVRLAVAVTSLPESEDSGKLCCKLSYVMLS